MGGTGLGRRHVGTADGVEHHPHPPDTGCAVPRRRPHTRRAHGVECDERVDVRRRLPRRSRAGRRIGCARLGPRSAVAGFAVLAGLALAPAARLHPLRDHEASSSEAPTSALELARTRRVRWELQSNLSAAATIPGVRLLLSLHAFYFVLSARSTGSAW